VQSAKVRVAALGARNISFGSGDAANGWRAGQHFDAIAITGSMPEYRTCFEQQLNTGGRLFAIVGERPVMSAMLVRRVGEYQFSRMKLFETDLPPLLNVAKTPVFAL
jgi:protein-L-isoaspartate(D-aspartate) O-methyltransferase